jgi:oligopeptide/dipeptide ABC transporter ATP-binding protein
MRLIETPPGEIVDGEIWFDGRDLLSLSMDEMRDVRGDDIAMIFQEPMTSLNPVFTVGDQISEAIKLHQKVSDREARNRAVDSLRVVGLSAPERRARQYPHEMSGGMRQRVMIAMALSCNPKLLIADEPTTALDVTIQAQILELIKELQTRTGTALLLITHDLAVVAETVQSIAVMYAGRIVETGTVEEVLLSPKHPYTQGLLNSIPSERKRGRELSAIQGVVPNPFRMPPGCKFQPRCPYEWDRCATEPGLIQVGGPDRRSRCWLQAPEEADRRHRFEENVSATVADVVG